MADPAPSTPLPAGPESRVGPADQIAALSGEPVKISQPEDDNPTEDRDASSGRQIDALTAMAPFQTTAPAVKVPANDPTKRAPATPSDSAQTPISPPAPREPASPPEPPRAADAASRDRSAAVGVKPQQGQLTPVVPSSPKAQDHPNEASRSPQGVAPLNGAAMVAAALTGGLRRPEPPVPAAPAAVSKAATSNAAASSDARAPTPSLLDRLAVKSILDNLRRPEARVPAPQTAPTPGATASASTAASTAPDATAKAASPAGGLRDKLDVFTADRMQARRDAKEIKGASQAGTAVLASLEALERQETTGILTKIRDAASANGGIEHVLSEMRPGGAFEDLRKEFNVALSHDEGFAAAYEKASGALSSYAETRAGMISAPRPRADVNLARLETLDQEIGAAARTLPGLKDGKNALDEALEGGREAVEKAFTAIRQAFTGDADVRGPSPSPRFGP
ncbi:hypothetical protein DFR50_13549 [Roseiarcus fermentans]|uniref:Uncharacterized protein n=1 Tax=Roseiarcus fermentans TaxID=1473586 RepID=A0A366EUU4_9HYPH|nr:hypothetical protein [Roseiarcus fermentans]RBP05259.1 hypothetical protein DFR50_13549 [Roseiarcus fermentans]